MNAKYLTVKASLLIGVLAGVLTSAGCAMMSGGQNYNVTLTGAQEVPPVSTQASGTARVTVAEDLSVSVTVTTSGIVATAAHIHQGAAGANGPVIVPFVKSGDNSFTSQPGAKLTPAQFEALKNGGLYVNVHSAARPGGEIRAQLVR